MASYVPITKVANRGVRKHEHLGHLQPVCLAPANYRTANGWPMAKTPDTRHGGQARGPTLHTTAGGAPVATTSGTEPGRYASWWLPFPRVGNLAWQPSNIANHAHARRPSETAPRPRNPKVANGGARTLAALATFGRCSRRIAPDKPQNAPALILHPLSLIPYPRAPARLLTFRRTAA